MIRNVISRPRASSCEDGARRACRSAPEPGTMPAINDPRRPPNASGASGLGERAHQRPGALRAPPQPGRHDVEPGRVERRVGGRQQRGTGDVEPQRRRQMTADEAGNQQRDRAEIAKQREPRRGPPDTPRRSMWSVRLPADQRPDHGPDHEQRQHQLGRRLAGVVVARARTARRTSAGRRRRSSRARSR